MAHSLWQLIRPVDGSWPFRDVIEQCKLRISPQIRGHLLRLSATCLSAVAVATLSETAIAGLVQVSDSINGATGCSYGALTPGGSFQGTAVPSPPAPMEVPCATDSKSNQVAAAPLSFTVHPGLPGQNGEPTTGGGIAIPNSVLSSAVGAYAENGGGGEATSTIYYELLNKQTGQIVPDAVAMGFNAGARVGADGFKFYNNAGYNVTISSLLGDSSAPYVQIQGGINNQNGSSFSTYQANVTPTLGVISSSPDVQADVAFQTSGAFVVSEEAYANDTSVAWVDPMLTPLNPDDVLVGSPFEGDPNTPLFTAAQLAEFQSFDIDISGIPSSTVQSSTIPEPSTGPLFASGFILFAVAAFIRARFAKC
jgi:hypothetical protein